MGNHWHTEERSSKEAIRVRNQLEALKSALVGTNADLLALLALVPESPPVIKITGSIHRRLDALRKLEINPNR